MSEFYKTICQILQKICRFVQNNKKNNKTTKNKTKQQKNESNIFKKMNHSIYI